MCQGIIQKLQNIKKVGYKCIQILTVNINKQQ